MWRMCNVRDLPVQDWVKLAVTRARATGAPAVFWLDHERAHDHQLIEKVRTYLPQHDLSGLDIEIMAPAAAARFSVERIRRGLDTISVTGNVLRDYNTDLFPILEVGTSAKMLSIVPLMNGGGLFETGAGGSAPEARPAVPQGELSALGFARRVPGARGQPRALRRYAGNPQARVLGVTLDAATGRLLDENMSPARKLGQIDNRGSHCFLAMAWAQAIAEQTDDPGLAGTFAPIAAALTGKWSTIDQELLDDQGHPNDIGGYYHPDAAKAAAAMRPSPTFNEILRML